jgi:hypothetical protein
MRPEFDSDRPQSGHQRNTLSPHSSSMQDVIGVKISGVRL